MAAVDLAQRLSDLERRLAAVERSNGLKHASVYDASTDTQVKAAPALISAEQASRSLAQVLVNYAGQAAADGIVNVFYSATEPTSMLGDGDLWLRSPDNKLLRFSSVLGTWNDFTDRVLADALQQARQSADEKIVSYWQATPPATGEDGDLWFDTSDGNKPYRWAGGSTGTWVPLTQGSLASQTFIPGSTGWALDDVRSEFGSVNIRDDLGATRLAGTSISVGADDLTTELLPVLSAGALALNTPTNAATNGYGNVDATERGILEFHVGAVQAGRAYVLMINGWMEATNTNSEFNWKLHATTDGTDPTTASPVINGGYRRMTMPAGAAIAQSFTWFTFYPAAADIGALRVLLTGQLVGGTGTCFIRGNDNARDLQWAWIDLGFLRSTSASDSVKRFTDGTTAEGDAQGYYRKRYPATWTHSYNGTLDTMPGVPAELYQGGTDDLRALIGFDYTTIAAALAGATIRDCSLIYRVKYAADNDGIDLNIGSHNYASEPFTWASGNVTQNRANPVDQRAGFTYKTALPNAVATELAAGTTRGISIGPFPSAYGYLYPDVQLEISYERT